MHTAKQGLQGKQDRLNAIHSGPFVLDTTVNVLHDRPSRVSHLENIQTDRTSDNVYVWMIAWSVELDDRRCVGIVRREQN